MKRSHTAGILGAGNIFANHAAAYRALGIPVHAIYDTDAGRGASAARRFQVSRTATSWESVVESKDIDLVSICSPPAFHKEQVIAALRAGKHVICEKPLTLSLADLDEIHVEASKATGRLTVVHQLRSVPAWCALKGAVSERVFGDISFVQMTRYDAIPSAVSGWGKWALTGGGAIMTKSIHELDLLLWIFGKVKRVSAVMGTFFAKIESEDHASAHFQFESGAIGSFSVANHSQLSFRRRLEIIGLRGNLTWRDGLKLDDSAEQKRLKDTFASFLEKEKNFSEKALSKIEKLLKTGKNPVEMNPHQIFIADFIRCIEGSGPELVTIQEERRAIELCTAFYQSPLDGETVSLPVEKKSRFYAGVSRRDYETKH